MKVLFIDSEKVNECVAASFDGKDFTKYDNHVLKDAAQDWLKLGTHTYPSLTINQKTFRGRLTPDNAFEAICASFIDEPRECRRFQRKHHIPIPKVRSTGINQRTLFYMILGLIVVNVVLILCYRRYLNKELKNEMNV